MTDVIEMVRETDPKTGRVTKTVTKELGPGPGDVTVITTTYTADGGIQMRVTEIFHGPADDPRARLNLVKRTTEETGEDGITIASETVELFGEGVNETPLSKTVTDWDVDPVKHKHKIKKLRVFHWREGKPGRWVQDTTFNYGDKEKITSVTHP